MEPKYAAKISRLLSQALRHDPNALELQLDSQGWSGVAEVLRGLEHRGYRIDSAALHELVASSDKQRFALSADGTRIRANQGHSIGIDLGLEPLDPPELLFHGTQRKSLPTIFRQGLRRMSRGYVHLSTERDTAMVVGSRHGQAVVLVVHAGQMAIAGYHFYLSVNGVWLVSDVPLSYIEVEP